MADEEVKREEGAVQSAPQENVEPQVQAEPPFAVPSTPVAGLLDPQAGPSNALGWNVFYHPAGGGDARPAKVVKVNDDGSVNLVIFRDGTDTAEAPVYFATWVPFGNSPDQDGEARWSFHAV